MQGTRIVPLTTLSHWTSYYGGRPAARPVISTSARLVGWPFSSAPAFPSQPRPVHPKCHVSSHTSQQLLFKLRPFLHCSRDYHHSCPHRVVTVVSAQHPTRPYATACDNEGVDDSYITPDVDFELENLEKVSDNEQWQLFRVNLYPRTQDETVRGLSRAQSVQEVFNIVEKFDQSLTVEQASQAVVTLWDLQKAYGRYGFDCSHVTITQLEEYVRTILEHPSFNKLLMHLEGKYKELDQNYISCMLLYLGKLGVTNESPVMQKLVLLSLEKLNELDLNALSRFTVYLRDQGNRAYFLQCKLLPLIANKLDHCTTPEELYLLTVCFHSTRMLISNALLDKYVKLIERKLEEGFFEIVEPKIILKILRLLIHQDFPQVPHSLCRSLMLSLSERVHTLTVAQVMELGTFFQSQLEPQQIMKKIQQYSLNVIEEAKQAGGRKELLCLAPFSSTKHKDYFEELVVDLLDHPDCHEHFSVIFKALRFVETRNTRLCHAFWNRSLETMEARVEQRGSRYLGHEDSLRRRLYHQYMYFNNNLRGTYRNYKLEQKVGALLLKEMNTPLGMIPSRVAMMAAFIIGYYAREGLPEEVVGRILLSGVQYSIFDALTLSRGIQIALLVKPGQTGRTLMQQLTTISRMLDTATKKHLKEAQNLGEVITIIRSYLWRQGSARTFLFDQMVSAVVPHLSQLHSRHLLSLSRFFNNTKYLEPTILEALVQYTVKNQEHMSTQALQHLLVCLYTVGYHPSQPEPFFTACTNTFLQECEYMSCLSVLRVCLVLNLYGHLPSQLVHHVFNLSFLDRLDHEISQGYSKASVPALARHTLMELNRAVCVDHPQEKVPWFHHKYCQELLHTVGVPASALHTEVHQALAQLVGGPEVLRVNVQAPYCYLLDFEFLLDEKDRPVPVREYVGGHTDRPTLHTRPGHRRMCVLVRGEDAYCTNRRQLMGCHQMECHHLEVLGYTVVQVPHFLWYSMAHPTFQHRLTYLRQALYPHS